MNIYNKITVGILLFFLLTGMIDYYVNGGNFSLNAIGLFMIAIALFFMVRLNIIEEKLDKNKKNE